MAPQSGGLARDPQFDALFASIKEKGIQEPITIKMDWTVVDGCHRLSAARLLGIEYVEVRMWTGTEFVS